MASLLDSKKTALVDQMITTFFEQSIERAGHIAPTYQQLWEILYELIRAGGKRLRPQMVLLAYEAFGGTDTNRVVHVAVAHELLHFCLLIHDDVIDRDYVRYGTANVAGRYKILYSQYVKNLEDQTHYAHSAALLGGDLMLSGAHQLIATSPLTSQERSIAEVFLTRAIFEVAGGELLDTELSFTEYATGDALRVARYKTASYSFVAPLLTGAKLANATARQIDTLSDYAQSLGIAYQLVDDILGVFGDQAKTGKSTSGDILEGKRTYMVEQALDRMSDSEKLIFEQSFGNQHATSIEIAEVKKLLESTGARQATQALADAYTSEALNAIAAMDLTKEHRVKFERLVNDATKRSY